VPVYRSNPFDRAVKHGQLSLFLLLAFNVLKTGENGAAASCGRSSKWEKTNGDHLENQ
jgi:hypothetical protein